MNIPQMMKPQYTKTCFFDLKRSISSLRLKITNTEDKNKLTNHILVKITLVQMT